MIITIETKYFFLPKKGFKLRFFIKEDDLEILDSTWDRNRYKDYEFHIISSRTGIIKKFLYSRYWENEIWYNHKINDKTIYDLSILRKNLTDDDIKGFPQEIREFYMMK